METEEIGSSVITSNARIWYGVWGARLVSILTWLMGGIYLISASQPAWMNRLQTLRVVMPLGLHAGSRLTIALAGLAVCLLAANLWRHKQAAWFLMMFLLAISTLDHLFRVPGLLAIALPICLLLILLSLGYSFYGQSDPPSVYWGLSVLASAFIVLLAYGVVGFMLEGIQVHQPVSLPAAISRAITMMACFYNTGPQQIHSFGWYFAGSIYIIMITAIGSALILLTRPVVLRHTATKDERRQVAENVKKYGRSILDPMLLFKDKHYFFSPDGSVIAYDVRGRGAMALGEPIGRAEDAATAIAAFKAYCARNDWQPYFLYVPQDGLANYHLNGFNTLCVAYEGRIPLASFSLDGHANKDVRHHYTKITRLGYQAKFYAPPLNDDLLNELRQVSDEWLSTHFGGEKYFFVGSFNDEYIRNSPVIAVYAPDGKVMAFANLVFTDHNRLITGDLVRCRTKVETGTMEFLTISMMKWAIAYGYETFSLSSVTAVGKGPEPEDPPIAKIFYAISILLNHLYKFRGIYLYKDKYHPHWEPYYIVYMGATAVVPALITMLRLYSGK